MAASQKMGMLSTQNDVKYLERLSFAKSKKIAVMAITNTLTAKYL